MKLSKIVSNITYKGKTDDREISYITHDSRKVKEGTLFIALKGIQSDGHDFIFDAIDKGAIAIIANGRAPVTNKVPILQVSNPRKVMSQIASNFFNTQNNSLKIIGITGTNGKTTTTQITNHILNYNNFRSGSLGTLGFDTPTGIKSTNFTTPESIDLHHILKIMKDGGIQFVPMEVSSHAIDMNRVDNVKFDIAIYTNLGFDHLDFHGNRENYFKTKLKLFQNLNNEAKAIINIDDEYANRIIENLNCKYFTYGINEKADMYIKKYTLGINESKAIVVYKKKEYTLNTSLVGKFNLYNILASILCNVCIGIDVKSAINSINTFKNVPGRFEKIKLPKKKGVAIIDYAHSPDAFENIYKNIKIINEKKKIISVFGCGGERDSHKRPKMAAIAESFSDWVIITNDNPRNENEDEIIKDIKKGFILNKNEVIKNRKEAIIKALRMSKNNIVVILGKGIEEYQVIKNKKIPHSDINTVENYVNENRN